jgi:hypothetical protein
MPTHPQPSINFHARIDLDTEARRRRLQERTGLSAPRLVREAFRELERGLDADCVMPPEMECARPSLKHALGNQIPFAPKAR